MRWVDVQVVVTGQVTGQWRRPLAIASLLAAGRTSRIGAYKYIFNALQVLMVNCRCTNRAAITTCLSQCTKPGQQLVHLFLRSSSSMRSSASAAPCASRSCGHPAEPTISRRASGRTRRPKRHLKAGQLTARPKGGGRYDYAGRLVPITRQGVCLVVGSESGGDEALSEFYHL